MIRRKRARLSPSCSCSMRPSRLITSTWPLSMTHQESSSSPSDITIMSALSTVANIMAPHRARRVVSVRLLNACNNDKCCWYSVNIIKQVSHCIWYFVARFQATSLPCIGLARFRADNNNNNNPICKAPECQKTSVALEYFRGAKRLPWRSISCKSAQMVPYQQQTVNHIVKMCPLTKYEGTWQSLHATDDDALN